MIEEISQKGFTVKCMDGAEGMLALPDKSIKLVYGSPPYPNAERDYGVWRATEYIDKYYGQLEIRWHSREKDRLERIQRKRRMANDEESNKQLQQKQSVAEAPERA